MKDLEDKIANNKSLVINLTKVTKEASKNTMDINTINAKFADIRGDVSQKPDKDDLARIKQEVQKYTDKSCALLKKETEAHIKSNKFEHDRLVAEFELHERTEFRDLVTKVTDVEKKN